MRVMIIGAGNQGCLNDAPNSGNDYKIISFAKAFKEQNAELIFFDTDIEKSKKAVDIWGGDYVYNIDDVKVDIIVITTPDNTHYQLLLDIANLDVKLVICEKPLCDNVKQIKEIVDLYDKLKIPLMVDFTRRFIPRYRNLKNDFKLGKLGKLVYGRCIFNRGLWHTGTHVTDLFNWLFNNDFSRIEMFESDIIDTRIWDLEIMFENYIFREQRIGDMPVVGYFSQHTKHVVDNAMAFLEGRQPIFSIGKFSVEGAEKLCLIREKKKQY